MLLQRIKVKQLHGPASGTCRRESGESARRVATGGLFRRPRWRQSPRPSPGSSSQRIDKSRSSNRARAPMRSRSKRRASGFKNTETSELAGNDPSMSRTISSIGNWPASSGADGSLGRSGAGEFNRRGLPIGQEFAPVVRELGHGVMNLRQQRFDRVAARRFGPRFGNGNRFHRERRPRRAGRRRAKCAVGERAIESWFQTSR